MIESPVLALALLGSSCFFALLWGHRGRDSGRWYRSFLYPLLPGFLYVTVELWSLLARPSLGSIGERALYWSEFSIFSCMGLSCVLFYEAHYRLNGIPRPRLIPLPLFIALTAVNYALLLAAALVPERANLWECAIAVNVYGTLLYSGAITVLFLRYGNRIHLATRAGVLSAGIGLIYFPFFALTDFFRLDVPVFVDMKPGRLQAYGLYYCIVGAVLLLHFNRSLRGLGRIEAAQRGILTRREEELARLILGGAKSGEIALAFGVSPSTVKTHVRNLYRKLGVHSREELSAALRRGES